LYDKPTLQSIVGAVIFRRHAGQATGGVRDSIDTQQVNMALLTIRNRHAGHP
jgi:hypothetical protein